jgi:putative ABC transport system permease protein
MFLRIVKDSFARQPRRKLLTAVALALATAVATATLSVALDVGDRLASEFRSLGANLLVTPQADALPLEIGGVDYRPVESGAYLPEADLGKLKTIFWRNNIIGFAPSLDVPVSLRVAGGSATSDGAGPSAVLIGTWYRHDVTIPKGGGTFATGVASTSPWWHVDGQWFSDEAAECVVGAALARRASIAVGEMLEIRAGDRTVQLRVAGIAATGGQEDDAVLAPLAIAQQLADRPGQYRRLLISALTKPEDAFSQRNPNSMTPVEFESWYCSPYISSISRQVQEQLPGVEVRPIRQIAEGEGRILTRVSALMWLVTLGALLAAALAVAATAATTVLVGERIFGVTPELRLILLPIVLGVAAVVATLGSLAPLRTVMRLDPAPVLRGE